MKVYRIKLGLAMVLMATAASAATPAAKAWGSNSSATSPWNTCWTRSMPIFNLNPAREIYYAHCYEALI